MIVPTRYPLARSDSLLKWRDRLAQKLDLHCDPVSHQRLSFCDSFDWRLFRRGLRLEVIESGDGQVMRLVRIGDDAVEVEQSMDTRARRFAGDLPSGLLRDRIAPVLGIRAFLPLVTLDVRRLRLRRLDSEGKTRLRVYVESFSRDDGTGKARVLLKQVRLERLRGYDKAAQRATRALHGHFALSPAETGLYTLALESVGRQPGDYSGKLDIALQPQMRADVAVRTVLKRLLSDMLANEPGTLADLDSEFLHDFRVAVRRTRSLLGELKRIVAPATLKRFRGEFAWLGGLTGGVRDLDVYLLKFDRYQASLPASLREGLKPLREFLRYKQHREHSEQLVKALRSARYRKLKQQWGRYLDSPIPKRPTARDAKKPVLEVAGRRTWKMYKRVIGEGRAITDESAPGELHELRKSCKKLRYLMEFFQSLYPKKAIKLLIGELKQLQDNLGDFQDLDVQIHALQGFAMEMRRRGEYSAETGASMQALLDGLGREMNVVRGDFHNRFDTFSAAHNRAHFAALLRADEDRAQA